MDVLKATELLQILADGINPITGELLPDTDSANQVEIVRALHTILNYVESSRNRSAKKLPENAGKPWNDAERTDAINEFKSGMSLYEIAKKHKRTSGAIRAFLINSSIISFDYKEIQ